MNCPECDATLNIPDGHQFIEGKPDVVEKIVEVKPAYSKLGPLFKKDSKNIVKTIESKKQKIIRKIEDNGDVTWSDISIDNAQNPNEKLMKNGYINVKKETQVKGKSDRAIIKFDNIYIEVSQELIK